MRIALAGNPNSGKTTMYNALTGAREKVGNWAGVTVEKKAHPVRARYLRGEEAVFAIDLPGTYSMTPFTSEESVTSEYIQKEKPDAIINIVDATNLGRSLFFTTQLLELGIPVVIALNKTDVNERKETEIDAAALGARLGCPVIETVSTSKRGLGELISATLECVGKGQRAPFHSGTVMDKADAEASDRRRYAFVNTVVAAVEKRRVYTNKLNTQDKIDAVLTSKWVGLPIFAMVMFLVFGISQAWLGPLIADSFTALLEKGQDAVARALTGDGGQLGIWASILVDGIIGGLIAVVGFLPLVMVMYFLIALLEDCGYMARATVVLDPIFKRVGLSGRSIIPFVIGTGCAVPGVMACRTIRDERERRATAMLAPFMPCGAKLPVISLFAGAFFGKSAWVGTCMYFVGILVILFGALVINKLTGNRKKSFFIIELPEYKLPSIPRAASSMCQRGWSYIVKAGTVILVCNLAVHLMQSFTWGFAEASSAEASILHDVATPVAFLLAPVVGVVAWQLAAAAITGFIAKENVVGTLAICFVGLENLIDTETLALMENAGTEVASVFAITKVAALAYLMFNLFSPPCFAAIGAMGAEMKSKKWFWSGIALQLGVGYSLAFLVFFFGTLFSRGSFGAAWMPVLGWAIVLSLAVLLLALILRKNKEIEREEAKKEQETKEKVGV